MKSSQTLALVAAISVFAAITLYSDSLGANDEVREDVFSALEEHPQIDAALFEVNESDDFTTIRRAVETDSMRELVIEQINKVDGVESVVDEIIVKPLAKPDGD